MPTRPRLVTSIPFWLLVAASLASAAYGAVLLVEKLGSMTVVLTDGSATPVDVYVGQSIAVVGAILLGAGIVGLLLALTVASLATLRAHTPAAVAEPIDWTEESDAPAEVDAAHANAEPVDNAEPVADAEPAVTR